MGISSDRIIATRAEVVKCCVKGMTQHETAEALGITRDLVAWHSREAGLKGKWKGGRTRPPATRTTWDTLSERQQDELNVMALRLRSRNYSWKQIAQILKHKSAHSWCSSINRIEKEYLASTGR